MKKKVLIILICQLLCVTANAQKEDNSNVDSSQELSLKLSNPVAKMISVPFQFNQMLGVGTLNGSELIANFQPVIPYTI